LIEKNSGGLGYVRQQMPVWQTKNVLARI